MDASTVSVFTSLIGSLGFPIVMCLLMFWLIQQNNKQHIQESEKWQECLNNNTKAIDNLVDLIRLADRLQGGDDNGS